MHLFGQPSVLSSSLPNENPYAAPETLSQASPDEASQLAPQERIPFRGTVSRGDLRTSLRTRLSWSGLATLGVGALICFAASPESFLNPFRRVGTLRIDPLGELLGLVGIGFVALASWHLISASTHWTVRQREANFLRQSPHLYEREIAGWISKACIHIREPKTETWVSWEGVGFYQYGDRALIIDWGAGSRSNTILTSNLFEDERTFRRVGRLFRACVSNQIRREQLGELDDYFRMEAFEHRIPAEAEVIGQTQKIFTCREAWWMVVRQIPSGMFSGTRPLHAFFGFLLVVAAVLAEHMLFCMVPIACVWLTIMVIGVIVLLYQHLGLLTGGKRRLIASRTQFTREEIIVSTTLGFHCAPISSFSVKSSDANQMEIVHSLENSLEDGGITFSRDDFSTDGQWIGVRQIFGLSP